MLFKIASVRKSIDAQGKICFAYYSDRGGFLYAHHFSLI